MPNPPDGFIDRLQKKRALSSYGVESKMGLAEKLP